MSSDIWFYIEHEGGSPRRSAHELAGKAHQLAEAIEGRAVGLAFGSGAAAVAAPLSSHGLHHLLASEEHRFAEYSVIPQAQMMADLARERQPAAILFPATPLARDIAARLQARLGAGLISNVTEVGVVDGDL
ncbi:MAG: hypothetical protein M1531_04150, partial [Chloroflexi bacterium]|nr:hypothetical protein [Chloroflexota bacterium]